MNHQRKNYYLDNINLLELNNILLDLRDNVEKKINNNLNNNLNNKVNNKINNKINNIMTNYKAQNLLAKTICFEKSEIVQNGLWIKQLAFF